MIAGFLGSNIEGVFYPDRKEELNGNWDELPPAVKEAGSRPRGIFAGWYDVEEIVGPREMENIPFGAVALYTLADKLSTGLKQLLAGVRKFNITEISRADLMSGNREVEELTGIPYMTEALHGEALDILTE